MVGWNRQESGMVCCPRGEHGAWCVGTAGVEGTRSVLSGAPETGNGPHPERFANQWRRVLGAGAMGRRVSLPSESRREPDTGRTDLHESTDGCPDGCDGA